MSAYVIAQFNILDVNKMMQYRDLASPSVAQYKGNFVTKGTVEGLTGPSHYSTSAIIEFDNKEAAKEWYSSPEYQQAIEVRNQAMDCQFILIDEK